MLAHPGTINKSPLLSSVQQAATRSLPMPTWCLLCFAGFFVGLKIKHRSPQMLGKHPTTETLPQTFIFLDRALPCGPSWPRTSSVSQANLTFAWTSPEHGRIPLPWAQSPEKEPRSCWSCFYSFDAIKPCHPESGITWLK